VKRGTVTSTIAATGQLEPLVVVEVSNLTSGRIVAINVDTNDRVKKGQVLAKLEPASTIVSPLDGVVLSRRIEVGQTVAGVAPLFTLAASLDRLELSAPVGEVDVVRLSAAMPASVVVDSYPHEVFHGTVRRVDLAPSSTSPVTYDVVIDINNAALRLRPGMTAAVSFEVGAHDNVLLIPVSALRFRPVPNGKPTVWVPRGSMLVSVPVSLGLSDGVVVEVVAGLTEADEVAIPPDPTKP
jgi:HlyD family secretion protein